MKDDIYYFQAGPNAKKAISVLLDAMTDTLNYPEATLTAEAVVPLFTIILALLAKLEETMLALNQRVAICEAAAFLSKDLTGPNDHVRSGR